MSDAKLQMAEAESRVIQIVEGFLDYTEISASPDGTYNRRRNIVLANFIKSISMAIFNEEHLAAMEALRERKEQLEAEIQTGRVNGIFRFVSVVVGVGAAVRVIVVGLARSFLVGADSPNMTSSSPSPLHSGGSGLIRTFSPDQGRCRVGEVVVGGWCWLAMILRGRWDHLGAGLGLPPLTTHGGELGALLDTPRAQT